MKRQAALPNKSGKVTKNHAVSGAFSVQVDCVGAVARTSNLLFGMPNALRANGVSETGFVGKVAQMARRANAAIVKDGLFHQAEVPVFKLERQSASRAQVLPRIWLSEEEIDASTETVIGRRFYACYPNGNDKGGALALQFAEDSFAHGVAAKSAHLEKMYFQAAEILYLHAAARGNAQAHVRLGAMYLYDVCKGEYWSSSFAAFAKHTKQEVLMKAYKAYSRGAARGISEAKWRLGDMISEGSVCQKNTALAFNVYVGAFARSVGCASSQALCVVNSMSSCAVALNCCTTAHDAGASAIRIAECFEQGRGIRQNSKLALKWLELAEAFLDKAVGAGAWFYASEQKHANDIRQRMCA